MTTPEADSAATIARLYADREADARRWHAGGGHVIGVLGATVPVELITAAGLYPLRLVGDPGRGTTRGDPYMEPVREGYLRAILEKLLAGDYDFLDLIVVPRSSEGLLQFYYLVEHIRSSEPARHLPALHLFDLLQTQQDYTRRYVAARMEELRARLGQIAGTTISDGAIAAAITQHDRARTLFAQIADAGRALPSALSGTTRLQLAGCGQCLQVGDFVALLERTAGTRQETGRGPRLLVKGSPHEHSGFYELVERTGATIVADDHDWGETLYRPPVGLADAPVAALVRHCMSHRPGPRRLPQADVDGAFLDQVREGSVDGVLFWLEQHDDTLGWDYPAQKQALDRLGVASILLIGQSYWAIDDSTAGAVANFVRELSK